MGAERSTCHYFRLKPLKNPRIIDSSTLPRVRMEFADAGGRFALSLGLPRSVGEIYGLLYLSTKPMSAPEIGAALSISKGSVSTGTRQLLTLGFIQKVWLQEERKDYFEAVIELGEMAQMAYERIVKHRAQEAERRFDSLRNTLAQEEKEINPEECAIIRERLEKLGKLQARAAKLIPLIEKVIR